MATTLPDSETMSVPPAAPAPGSEEPELPMAEDVDVVLVERLPPYLRMTRGASLLIVFLSLLFWRLCTRPLYHTDLWGHLSFGRWIWSHGALPTTEPFLPLAQGMPVVDSAWLSQLLGYGWYQLTGTAGMQFVMSASITTVLGCLAYLLYRQTQRASMAFLGIVTCLWLSIQQFLVGWGEMPSLIRPQILGVAIYAWIFCRMMDRKSRFSDWYLIPASICLWANLHGSFVIGIISLGLVGLGRSLDTWWRTGQLSSVWRRGEGLRWILIAEISSIAALVNPYGLGLYSELLQFASNRNLFDLLDWEPLTLKSGQGRAVALVTVVLMILYRLSPRRVSLSEFFLLLTFGLWALWASRMLVWWSIPAAYFTALHWNAVRNRRRGTLTQFVPQTPTGLWSVVAVGVMWIGFALTPMGGAILHRQQPALRSSVSRDTPIKAVEYLLKMKEPLRGQVFNSYEWGDYLGWAGPQGIKLFVNSHVHLIPREVWQSYMQVSRLSGNWEDQLDRYGVNYVVIDRRQLSALSNQLRTDEKWRLAYEDGMASIFVRRKLI